MTSTSASTPKSIKHVSDSESPIISPLAGSGPGGHKPSFKSTKLARRARSFKDDFLGKISQMRSPTGPVLRSHSPKDRSSKGDVADHPYPITKGPIQELDNLWKQTQATLKHFKDVVSKQKLEMLPGNGTIVLDTVWQINLAVRSSVSSDSSSAIFSATNHMYQSVARLIKLCDDALIDDTSSELTKENVNEIVSHVEMAVQDLIRLAQEKISQQQINYKTTPRSSYVNSLDMSTQRNSLPDIPLTPRERQLLEQNSGGPPLVRSSHSSESILRDSSPPPKPPLPDGVLFNASLSEANTCITPPPLPPKKKNSKSYRPTEECCSIENSPHASSLERVSFRSKSPEDSMSLLSASAGSLDSMLNHSRGDEDEELKDIMNTCDEVDGFSEHHPSDIFGANGTSCWEESSLNSNISSHIADRNYDYNRFSNSDSGIVSRSSVYSKRSSQQSSTSSHWVSRQQTTKQASEVVHTESVVQNLQKDDEAHLTIKRFNQKTTSSSSSSSSSLVSTIMSSNQQSSVSEIVSTENLAPPAIPQKTRKKQERQPSPYDNVPDTNLDGELLVTCQMHQSHQSLSSNTSSSSMITQDSNRPPPLPPKKKHIMAYMEMFGNCSHANEQEFMRHSVHMVQAHWGQPSTPGLPTTQSCSFSHTAQHVSSQSSHTQIQILNVSPHSAIEPRLSPMHSPNSIIMDSNSPPPALPPKQRPRISSVKLSSLPPPNEVKPQSPIKALPDLLEHTTNSVPRIAEDKNEINEGTPCDIDLMEEQHVEKWLIMKKPEEDGPDIRGGPIDALIIQATKATKNGVFMYQEAFLTTYRTFISPSDLISKLIKRYEHFSYPSNKKLRSEAFALIVRVVNDLTVSDLDNELQCKLMNFVQQLISSGEITLAKALRVKHLERYEAKQMSLRNAPDTNVVTSLCLSARHSTLLDFKSEQIAEQMTLLDAELFMKIEIPEVLIWAQEQNEERSPNLTRFTEHFNKMSYWARTRILTAEGKDVREKYFLKYIKIMKHLRKINNFNSYLALLSALDSAPIRRLEWQKHVQEGLKEYCALIDSSSSFRAYRQALAETQPPCIPYIGLVLQDLTFVHIGNSNLLNDGTINFSKRWQQFNIVENMKKFKKGTHSFKRNERIIQFFQNFDDFIGEDAMWQLSESIKPRGGKKTT